MQNGSLQPDLFAVKMRKRRPDAEGLAAVAGWFQTGRGKPSVLLEGSRR